MNLLRIIRLPELMEANTRIQELRGLINRYNHSYYVLHQSDITDQEYDQLYTELVTLEKKYPELDDPNSPTKRVGVASADGFKKVRHERRMLSLDNTYSAKELLEFFDSGEQVFVEPKIDGLSLKLIYRHGKLEQALTRGNGEEGDEVTVNARTINTIPLALNEPLSVEVTGEVYMAFRVFNKINAGLEAAGDDLLANPRNAASGALKLKNPSEVAERGLSFVAHGCNTEIKGVKTHEQLVEYLEFLGLPTTPLLPALEPGDAVSQVFNLTDVDDLKKFLEAQDLNRKRLDVATDGLVFKINNLSKQRELGDGTRSPRWAAAYKYPAERKLTTLRAVTLQVGKTGRVTPVAELEPVLLSGTTVRRASLCNQDEIERLGIDVGDSVYVEKSAEIIPKVVGVAREVRGGRHWKMPAKCPCCSTPLVRLKLHGPTGDYDSVDFYCPNYECEDQAFARLKFATGKAALDIDGCGEVMVRELMRHGVRKLSDLFALKKVDFFKPAARKRFLEGRERSKQQPYWRKLAALSIDGMGRERCLEMNRWPTLVDMLEAQAEVQQVEENLIRQNQKPDEAQRVLIKDSPRNILGNAVYDSLINFLEKHADEIDALESLGFHLEADKATTGKLSGKVFVITGTLMSGGRDEVIRRIEKAGGVVKSSVTSKVHYLIMGEDAGRTKTQAAEKHGVKVISEEDLYALMGIPMPEPSFPEDPFREVEPSTEEV